MADIIIKGMEMPETMIAVFISHDGKVFPVNRAYRGEDWEYVKAIQLPAHGRLIDADALAETVMQAIGTRGSEEFVLDLIEEAETIVPAEGGGEDG